MRAAGYLAGEAYEGLAGDLYDSFSFGERREGMRRVIEQAGRAGLTGIHCLEGYGGYRRHDFQMMLELDGGACDLTLYARDENPYLTEELGIRRFGGCWCLDGAIGSHTAAVSEPYVDKPDSDGELYFLDQEIGSWVESGLSRGMQVCNHVIGDRAIEQGLGVYERCRKRYDLPAMRPRLDHFILGTEQQAERAAKLGVCSAMQPAFDAAWGGASGGYSRRLGPERALRTNPIAMAIKSGMRIAGSSDSYITPLDPLHGIRAAMRHHNPEQRVEFDTAVAMFSSEAAYLAHQEHDRGAIREGLSADLTVVDGDRGLDGASVVLTIKAGQVVYDSAAGG
jgi:predicted amidohydrolase YtcJ